MKIKHKKVAASGIAVALAGVLGVGALLQTSVSVQASSAMMPGIEEIVSEASADKPFKILEIVDNTQDAEIGYYVSGQEPYIKLYSYTYKYKDENNTEQEETIHFQTLEEGLEKLPSDTLRKEFAQNVKIDDGNISGEGTGIKNIQSICYQDGSTGDAGDYPLSYSPYVEQYLISSDEEKSGNWTRIDFKDAKTDKSRTDTVKINGEYRENSAGTGDYTKQEQTYYPIREDSDDKSKTDKYRENIQNFYYADGGEANAPYFLEFEEVDNATVNAAFDANHNKTNGNSILSEYNYENGEYGYYENVYSDLTQEIVENITKGTYTFPGENPEIDLSSAVQIPNITSTTSVNARTFSDGTGDFSSINEQNPTDTKSNNADQTNISADNSQTADAFSSGDFSDGVSADGDIGNNDTVQTQNVSDTGTDSDFDAGANQNATTDPAQTDTAQATAIIENDKIEPIIAYTQKTDGNVTAIDDSVGKSENPKVYYGRTIDQYPYYQYTLISDMRKVITCATENQEAVDNGTFTPAAETDPEKRITFQDNQYWYWTVEANGTVERNPISVVTQRQPVSYDDIREIPQGLGYNYYYKVKQAYFCCKKGTETDNDHTYEYYGWYSPSYPDQNNVYIKVSDGDGKVATHYISEAEYKLTPGIGNYDFVPDETKDQKSVEVNHMYYQGGYKNNDWFKRYVFHLTEGDEKSKEQFDKFNIEVDTISAEDFNKKYGIATTSMNGTEAVDSGQAADSAQSDGTDSTEQVSETGQIENTDQMDDTSTISTDGQETEADGSVSEVESMVSEAGVELVSIENEISDGTSAETIADEFQDGTDTETPNVDDVISDNSSAFSAGDASMVETTRELLEYGLVYINGQVDTQGIQNIYNNSIPCIINTNKLGDGNTTLANAVSSYIIKEDSDGHYVNTYMYFFKNKFPDSDQASLINSNFHTNFNPDGQDNKMEVEGFEEILEYIESENKYRQLGQTSSISTTSTEEEVSDGTDQLSSGDVELLEKDLSQARVIEYIINYKYKRITNRKQDIKVLEIMPDENCSQIDDKTVVNWLSDKEATKNEKQYAENESADANCWHGKNNSNIRNPDSPNKAIDNNPDTLWHSAWNSDSEYSNCKNHEHYLEVTLKKESTINGFEYTGRKNADAGVLKKYRAEFFDSEGNLIGSTGSKTRSTGITRDNYSTIGKVTLSFGQTFTEVSKVRIYFSETLDTDGFASCVQINFFYDPYAVYPEITHMTASEFAGHIDDIGSEYDMIYISDAKTEADHSLITGGGNLRYVHVGSAVSIKSNDQHLLKLLGQLDKDYLSTDRTKFAPYSTYNENGSGYFRGSGNDMTKQQYNMLMEFVKSGYPVVFADGLVSGKKANSEEVDASSYYSQFITDALEYNNNVYTKSELDNEENKDIYFFSNLAKPVIDFDVNGRPVEPERLNKSVSDGTENHYIEGKLEYTFTVKNDSDSSPATTSYDCNLYLDLNFDGNYSRNENQSKYIEIKDSDGNVLSRNDNAQYELKVGKKYTLTRKIPSDYFKIIAWKLELTNNRNMYIHTSETGYAKQKGDSKNKQTINVIQLVPDRCTWTLEGNTDFDTYMNRVEDFQLNLKTVYVKDINDGIYKMDGKTYINLADMLKDQQMLIIGFADVYKDIKISDVQAILDFIRSGRSVIFSHDTTSYVNYNYNEMNKSIPKNNYNNLEGAYNVPYDNYLHSTANNVTWGLSLNTILRSITGMDRYGITSDEDIKGTSVGTLLKQGNALHDGTSVNFEELMKLAGDIAYQQNDKTSSYAQTQGYTNVLLLNKLESHSWNATKVNDGAITQYPYKIKDNISIAETHGQYYQLALEQDRDINGISDGCNDVVVWYCLPRGAYGNSTNDVRNDYYFYSKGNVIYTGAGHSSISNADEIQLFVNAIVAAANVTAVKPEVSFVKSLNPSAEVENIRYYMTDQKLWTNTDQNTLEKDMDFYINVKDYNMVSADLNQDDLDKQEITMQFYIEDDKGEVQDSSGTNQRLLDITRQIQNITEYGGNESGINVSNDGMFHTRKNNAFGFSVKNIEDYLHNSSNNDYKSSCKIYAKISSTVYLYNVPKKQTVWTSIDLKQRQLFDLD